MVGTPRTGALGLAALFLVATGCATLSHPRPTLVEAAPADGRALRAAADAFYAASDVAQLRAALERARSAGPDSGLFHELAATMARFEDRTSDEFEHRLAALRDPSYDATALQLQALEGSLVNVEQRARLIGHLEMLSESHPDPAVRATAAYLLTSKLQADGDHRGTLAAVAKLGPTLPFAVVGGWDNDQGKGFDAEQAPERGVDLGATYEGSLMPIAWAKHPPRDARGELELSDFIAPGSWSVAYAATGVKLAQPGDYELRLSSTDPVKVWVNGVQVFEARELERGWLFDQFVIPVSLPAGESQVLVKSAHRTGSWVLLGRLTGKGGAQVPYEAVPAGPVKTKLDAGPLSADDALVARVGHLERGSPRFFELLTSFANAAHGGHVGVAYAQSFLRAHPDSLVARYTLMKALWSDDERGRTADLLGELDKRVGEDLVQVRVLQARFWVQEGLRARARKALLEVVRKYPERPAAQLQLAALFDAEKWSEDECRALEALDERLPNVTDFRLRVAQCWMDEHREERALPLLRELEKLQPRSTWVLYRLEDALRAAGRLDEAAKVGREVVATYPEQLWPRLRLAETLRQSEALAEADQVLAAAQQAFPSSAAVHKARASLAWRKGNEAAAVEHWQAALVRDPDDDVTANRLDFVSPAATGPWASDIPDEEALAKLVASRKELEVSPGADLAYLLDHEVVQLRSDGSTLNVVTQVVTALDQAGRDNLTRIRLQYGGRHRVTQAYSVDKSGRRAEASVRAREVLYRGLDVGSTIVLQYRADSPPSGFLPRYLSRSWFFQALNDQRRLSQFVLWYPAGSRISEDVTGKLDREERRVGDEVRVSWTLRDTPPVLSEPGMPPLHEVVANLQLTTIPGWQEYEKWEAALLEGAIRDSAEVDQLAAKIGEGAKTVEEKLLRIHEFVMEEIRYQQDYESFIAGVKPHPASMVVERRYGDCKDKTVLFMTLARKLGVKAEFATVRTRDKGAVRKALPTQQFNHAIVYVPAQPGLEQGRFFDSTADALDLDVLREDDAGTESLVYDPQTRKHRWVPIPWQSPEHHQFRTHLTYALAEDGSAKGELVLDGRGRLGSLLRRVARNPEHFKQFVQMVAGAHFPGAVAEGAQPVEVQNLRGNAQIRAAFSAPNAARVEGDVLRVRLPTEWTLGKSFNLARRRHDLILGTPNQQQWRFDVALPPGTTASRLPSSGEVNTDCLSLSRTVKRTATGIAVEQALTVKCDRITADQYPAYRAQVERMNRLLDEELVVTPAVAKGAKKKVAAN